MLFFRSPPDGFLKSVQRKNDVELEYLDLLPCAEVFTCEDNVFYLTKAEEKNTMNTGEDEASPSLNGRLRPRKSTNTTTPNPQNKIVRRAEGKVVHDRPKRASTSSKASPSKQDDLVTKSDPTPAPLFLCPYCDKNFNTRSTASKHARRIHLSTTKQDKFIKCLYCNHSDAESNTIIKHMVDSHPNQYFACLDCYTRFPSTTELAEHKLNVCEKQKQPYRSKLRDQSSSRGNSNSKKTNKNKKPGASNENTQLTEDLGFSGIVISCELKPSETHDAADIEDKITTNLIVPSANTLGKSGLDKNAVIVLDDLQWNKRLPPNFTFHNTDADQILSRLGVVHRSPRVGESRKDLIKMMDEPNEKFEKCFDTNFYSKVAKNVQENLTKYLDGTFKFNPNKDSTIKTRKSKASVMINTAEGFPILLAQEQFTRNLFDGLLPRAIAPKHKWKWDNAENDKNLMMLLDQTKRDSHVNGCIITLISSLDIWTQLRMKSKFEEIFKTTPIAKKTEKQNIISMELKEILESRDIPATSSQVVQYKRQTVDADARLELPTYLGLSATSTECKLQPAVLSGEWVRPRCYVCCACGDQTRDARTLSSHLSTQHPNAQVQHYEIVGETLLSADILKHLYVPPSQMSNRTRPPRGFRDCTKCKKSITLEDLHQHMLDCAGDTPAVRRKCRYRPFGVRRRRPRLPDNTIRKKIRKNLRTRHRQKPHMRPRPRIRTEVGDAETIRKMIADLPAKRNRVTPVSVLRSRRTIIKTKTQVNLRSSEDKKPKQRLVKSLNKPIEIEADKKQIDTDNSSTVDEDDQPLKLSATRLSTRCRNGKEVMRRRIAMKKNKKNNTPRKKSNMEMYRVNIHIPPNLVNAMDPSMYNYNSLGRNKLSSDMTRNKVLRPAARWPDTYQQQPFARSATYPYKPYPTHAIAERERHNQQIARETRRRKMRGELIDRARENNQSILEFPTHRIDVTAPGPSNIRQHSSRNNTNIQGSKDHPIRKQDGSNQNNNMTRVPSVPLKHSIASLTSGTKGNDSSMPYNHAFSVVSDNNSQQHVISDNRKEFANEAIIEEVFKPPLLNDNSNIPISGHLNIIPQQLYGLYPVVPRDANKFPLLSNDSIELGASYGHMFWPKGSPASGECVRQLPLSDNFKTPEGPFEELPLPKNLKDSNAPKTIDTKLQTDKSKCSKTRKGIKIESCIAMIRTKKGLRLDKTPSELAPPSPKPPSAMRSEPQENEVPKCNTVTPVFEDHVQNEEICKTKDISNDLPPEEKKSNKENPELNVADSSSFSITSVAYMPSQIKDSHTESIPDAQSCDFESDISKLQDFWITALEKCQSEPGFTYQNARFIALKFLSKINIPYLSENMMKMQDEIIRGQGKEITLTQLYKQSFNIIHKKYNRQIPTDHLSVEEIPQVDAGSSTEQEIAIAAHSGLTAPQRMSQNNPDTENLTVDSQSRQFNDSPTSRRTRRKPAKKTVNLEQNVGFRYEKSMLPKHEHSLLSHHDALAIKTSSIDSNVRLASASNLSAVEPSSEPIEQKNKPPTVPPKSTRVRRESCKQVANSPDLCINIFEQTHAQNIQHATVNNLSRYSTEIADAQIEFAKRNQLVEQAQRFEYAKAVMGEHLRNASPEDGINNNPLYYTANDNNNRYPTPSLMHLNQDNHGVTPGNPKASNNESNNTIKSSQEYEQLTSFRKQRSEIHHTSQCHDPTDKSYYSCQEANAIEQQCNVFDSNLRKPPARRSSEVFYTRSRESYKYPNIDMMDGTDRSYNEGANNIQQYETSDYPRVYPEPFIPFTAHKTHVYYKNRYNPTSLASTLCRAPNMDEVAPLDLSCVPREDIILDMSNKATDLSKNKATNEKSGGDVSIMPNIPHHPVCTNESVSVDGLALQEIIEVPAKTLRINESPESYTHGTLNRSSDQNCYQSDTVTVVSAGNASNHSSDQFQHLTPSCNYERSQSETSYISDSQEYLQEKTFFEHKKIARRTSIIGSETKLEDTVLKTNTTSTLDVSNLNLVNTNHDGSHPNMGQHMVSANVPTSNADERIIDTCSKGTAVPLCDNHIDQDAETARKIAMLPEELAKILGTIPKDHRNQLLNVLPHYVTAPVPNFKNSLSLTEAKQNTPYSDTSGLSVSTAISPSRVIPKKRHSPSQPRGTLNSSENQMSVPLPSPVKQNESETTIEFSQTENFAESKVLNNSSEKDIENIQANIHHNSNLEVPVSVGKDLFATTSMQLSSVHPPTKQKPSNERTASLRAVRIKTTSAKKACSDDKNLLVNSYCKDNTDVDEKHANLENHTVPIACVINQSDLKHENVKFHNQHLKNYSTADLVLQESTSQGKKSFDDSNDIHIPKPNIETIKIHDELTNCIRDNDNVSSNDVIHFKQSIDTVERSTATEPLLESHTYLVEQDKSTTSFNSDISELNIFASRSSISSYKDSEETLTKPPQIQSLREECNNLPEIKSTRPDQESEEINNADNIEDSHSSSSNSAKTNQNIAPNGRFDKSVVSSLTTQTVRVTEAESSKNKISNEDDSEDDVSLAVIKQKHCSPSNTVEIDFSSIKTIDKLGKLKGKMKRKPFKKVPKNHDHKISKMSETPGSDKVPENDPVFQTQVKDLKEVKTSHNDVKEKADKADMLSLNTMTIESSKVNSFEVNKENNITENINSTKNNFDGLSPICEHNLTEYLHDDSSSKSDRGEHEDTAEVNTEQMSQSSDLRVSLSVESDKTYAAVKQSRSKNGNDNSKMNELTKAHSSKLTSSATAVESDFNLCSKISKINMPLRRSRRGKSMYTENNHIEENENNEDHFKRTPLTMKMLILSRVEKDKKRKSESSTVEKRTDGVDCIPMVAEHVNVTASAREKNIKRKKSLCSRRSLKKNIPTGVCELDGECSDINTLQPEKRSLITKELSYEEQKIVNDFYKEDAIYQGIDNTSKLSGNSAARNNKESEVANDPIIEFKENTTSEQKEENITEVSDEISNVNIISEDSEVANDTFVDGKETTSGMKKENITKISDIFSSKVKKTKHPKKGSDPQSDFDSDDDKVLLDTKVLKDKHVIIDEDSSSYKSKNKYNKTEPIKCLNDTSSDMSLNKHMINQTSNASTSAETRTTCYSKPISNKRSRSSSSSLKYQTNYDPYDIDFDDLLAATEPIIKKKRKSFGNTKLHDHKLVKGEDLNKTGTKSSKQIITKAVINVNNESDSDSSKSDVPLQKYVEEKAFEFKNKSSKSSGDITDRKWNKKASNKNSSGDNADSVAKRNERTSNEKDPRIQQTPITVHNDYNEEKTVNHSVNIEVSATSFNSTKYEGTSTITDSNSVKNISSNAKQKQIKIQNRKCRRASIIRINNVDSLSTSNEVSKQLQSDKFMENFGFYSERIPRKSNLLAAKKISATFHNMISSENDDCFYGFKEKTSRKTTPCENKKKSENADTTISSDLKTIKSDKMNCIVVSAGTSAISKETHNSNELNNALSTEINDSFVVRLNKECEQPRSLKSYNSSNWSDQSKSKDSNISFSFLMEEPYLVSKQGCNPKDHKSNCLSDQTKTKEDSMSFSFLMDKTNPDNKAVCDPKNNESNDLNDQTKTGESSMSFSFLMDEPNPSNKHISDSKYNESNNLNGQSKTKGSSMSFSFLMDESNPDNKEVQNSKNNELSIDDGDVGCLATRSITVTKKLQYLEKETLDVSDSDIDSSAVQANTSSAGAQTFEHETLSVRDSDIDSSGVQANTSSAGAQTFEHDTLSVGDSDIDSSGVQANTSSAGAQTFEHDTLSVGDSDIDSSGVQANTSSAGAQNFEHETLSVGDSDIDSLAVQANTSSEGAHNLENDALCFDDGDLDVLAAQAIMNSQEVRNLDNDLFSGLREADQANAARNYFVGYQSTSNLDVNTKNVDPKNSNVQAADTVHNIEQSSESTKKCSKNKQINQPGVKDKMYPDIEEIDMFEDKFDKIKRKRRSQAVAAKQVQVTNTSSKCQKKTEKKRNSKNSKKSKQSTHVRTKGALKGFEGIKISIPTQDLNLPINVSPPRQSKKRRKTAIKQRKETTDTICLSSQLGEKEAVPEKNEKDIYEFKDEDTELFELRPSTVMDRFRSMHNKNKYKRKEKVKDVEKQKSREKERKTDVKELVNLDTQKEHNKVTKNENGKSPMKSLSKNEGRLVGKETNYGKKNQNPAERTTGLHDNYGLKLSMDKDSYTEAQKDSGSNSLRNQCEYDDKNNVDIAIPGTSGCVPVMTDESDSESEISSPEGDFIFYTSNDLNCACPSENDSEDSDVERGCGRLNCVNKNKNADKNTAIGNIFKNNAVRCEKPEIKEPTRPKPNMDQLFDSLLETESKSDLGKAVLPTLPNKEGHTSKKDLVSVSDENFITKSLPQPTDIRQINKTDESTESKSKYQCTLSQDDCQSDSDSMQIFSADDITKQNVGYSLMSEECTQVNFGDIIADNNDKKIEKNEIRTANNEDEFDINEPESTNKQFMHLILPSTKSSSCVQTDNKTDNLHAERNQSAHNKSPSSEANNTEIYTMVSAQGTQTDKLNRRYSGSSKQDDSIRPKSEDELEPRFVPSSRIRLQKFDIRDHKTKSSKGIQTDKRKKITDDDEDIKKYCDRSSKKPDLAKSNDKNLTGSKELFHEENATPQPEHVDLFPAPVSRPTADKHSPRKSDEGISTSHDYSADAFDQSLIEETGVAHQRARRKCAVGKQNVLAEHWSSESELEGGVGRPNSADSIAASAPRRKKSRKKEGHHGIGRKGSRHSSGTARAPPGPKMRARIAHHYWSSEGEEETADPQPQHGWIVGDSHKKLVTMLAHAKGRKRHHSHVHSHSHTHAHSHGHKHTN